MRFRYLTRDALRYNNLQWGFNGYDASFDDHTCEPIKHFVYLKTHKTGSSTLCNMVHRFVMKHNLSAALPWSNQFYAWPSLKAVDIVRATERREPLNPCVIDQLSFVYHVSSSQKCSYMLTCKLIPIPNFIIHHSFDV